MKFIIKEEEDSAFVFFANGDPDEVDPFIIYEDVELELDSYNIPDLIEFLERVNEKIC